MASITMRGYRGSAFRGGGSAAERHASAPPPAPARDGDRQTRCASQEPPGDAARTLPSHPRMREMMQRASASMSDAASSAKLKASCAASRAAEAANKAAEAVGSAKASTKATVTDALDEMQRRKEERWRHEVLINPDSASWQFKPYAEWSIQFERKASKQPSLDKEGEGCRAAAKRVVKEKARVALLSKIRLSLTVRIMKIILEVVSQMCSPVEGKVREASDELGALLNAISGCILTYRFGLTCRPKLKCKFEYLRTVATAHLADTAALIFKGVDGTGGVDVDANLLLLERMINKEVIAKKDDVKALVEARLLHQAPPSAAQLGEAAVASIGRVVGASAGGSVGNSVCTIAGAKAGVLASEAMANAASDCVSMEEVTNIADRGIAVVHGFFRMFVLARMDTLVEEVPVRLSALLARARARYMEMEELSGSNESTGGTSAPAEARHGVMLAEVDAVYAEVHKSVSGYVGMLVDMMDAFSKPGLAEDVESDDDDASEGEGYDPFERM